ncbi:MAG: SagB/ThcOx family dehydrogenase [Bacillota bacterium]
MTDAVRLPPPARSDGPGLWQALSARRSVRRYPPRPISLQELSQLAWAAQGETARAGDRLLRTAPSAGATYPTETYIFANRVDGLEPGLYRYAVADHALTLIRGGDLSSELKDAVLGQGFVVQAAVVFAWTVVMERTSRRYGTRARQYVFMDCGHIGQNLALAAAAMGMGSCAIGAFSDEAVAQVLGVDGVAEQPAYLTSVGWLEA